MSITIERLSNATGPITCTSVVADCPAIDLTNHAGGVLYCDAASPNPVTVKFYGLQASGGAAYELRDLTNTAISISMQATCCYEMPSQLFASAQFKVATTSAGNTVTVRFIGKA